MVKQDIKEIQNKVEEQQKVIEEYLNTLKRLQADFENYVKRVEKEKEEFVKYSNHKLIIKLLNIADDFEKALEIMNNTEISDGIEMIYKQLHKILQEEGVTPINVVGSKLDPYIHDVVDIVTGEKDDVVVGEIQRGYIIQDKVLRPSKVRISKINIGGKNEHNSS